MIKYRHQAKLHVAVSCRFKNLGYLLDSRQSILDAHDKGMPADYCSSEREKEREGARVSEREKEGERESERAHARDRLKEE